MQSRRVLVTGANGFIGRHLCLKLIASGREVVACVRHGADISSLSDLEGKLQIRRIVAPVEKDGLTEALKSVDAVIHLAGRAHVMNETVADPLQEFRNANVRGTRYSRVAPAKPGSADSSLSVRLRSTANRQTAWRFAQMILKTSVIPMGNRNGRRRSPFVALRMAMAWSG